MNLEAKHEKLLIEIHDSENERLEKDYVEKQLLGQRPNLLVDLNQLIENELVEFDETDHAYYLTYEGYEEVLSLKSDEEVTEVEFKKRNTEFLKLIMGGLLLLGFTIFILSNNRKSNTNLISECRIKFCRLKGLVRGRKRRCSLSYSEYF